MPGWRLARRASKAATAASSSASRSAITASLGSGSSSERSQPPKLIGGKRSGDDVISVVVRRLRGSVAMKRTGTAGLASTLF